MANSGRPPGPLALGEGAPYDPVLDSLHDLGAPRGKIGKHSVRAYIEEGRWVRFSVACEDQSDGSAQASRMLAHAESRQNSILIDAQLLISML